MNARGHYGRRGRYVVGADAPSAASLQEDLASQNEEILALQRKIQDQRATQALGDKYTKRHALEVFHTKTWLPFLNNWQHFFDGTQRFLTNAKGTPALNATLPVLAAQFRDFRNQWFDMHVDANVLLNALEQAEPLPPPRQPAPSPPQQPMPPFVPPPARTEDQKISDGGPGFGLYAALGLGLVAVAAFTFAGRG